MFVYKTGLFTDVCKCFVYTNATKGIRGMIKKCMFHPYDTIHAKASPYAAGDSHEPSGQNRSRRVWFEEQIQKHHPK